MIKKIGIDELETGMNVCGVGKGPGEDLFFMNNIIIRDASDIQSLVDNGYKCVFVDLTGEGGQVREPGGHDPIAAAIGADCLNRTLVSPPKEDGARNEAGFREELSEAYRIRHDALGVVKEVLCDARLGKSIDKDRIDALLGNIVDSIFRNRHALTSLARLKAYDDYTFTHSVNVCILSVALGRNLELSKEELMALGVGALLHDLGKILLPESLVNKPGIYTAAERVKIQEHPSLGADFISESADVKLESIYVISQHHERYDGSGYQWNLRKDEIHLFARIAGVTDIYDAMTTDRVYRKGLLPTEVLKILYLRGADYFGPGLVDSFIRSIGIYPIGSLVELNTGEVGLVTSVNQSDLIRPNVLVVYGRDRSLYDKPFNVDLKDNINICITGILDPKSYRMNFEAFLS